MYIDRPNRSFVILTYAAGTTKTPDEKEHSAMGAEVLFFGCGDQPVS